MMVCAVIVYFSDPGVAKFVDPIASIISAILLLVLSYPYSEYFKNSNFFNFKKLFCSTESM